MTETALYIQAVQNKYFIISQQVKAFIEELKTYDDFEISYMIDKFFESKPLLTTAERNFLKEVQAHFMPVLVAR